MYGIAGERRLTELELDWLDGYEGSSPVRIGNAASGQRPARRLRRGRWTPCTTPAARGSSRRPKRAALQREAARVARGRLARARRGDLGGAWTATPLHALEGDGVGRVRPRGAERRGASARRSRRPLAGAPRRDPRRGLPQGIRRGARRVHPVLRLDAARREPAADAARRLPPRRRLARRRHGRRDRARPRARRARRAVPRRRREHRRRRSAAGRGDVPAVLVLARPGDGRSRAAWPRRRRSSSGCSGSATTSACSPRSTTSTPDACVGNFPQAFTHLTLVDAALTLDEGWCRRADTARRSTRRGPRRPASSPAESAVRSFDGRRRASRPGRARALPPRTACRARLRARRPRRLLLAPHALARLAAGRPRRAGGASLRRARPAGAARVRRGARAGNARPAPLDRAGPAGGPVRPPLPRSPRRARPRARPVAARPHRTSSSGSSTRTLFARTRPPSAVLLSCCRPLRGRALLRPRVSRDVVPAADARDGALRRHPPQRRARLRRRCPRLVAGVARRMSGQRRHAAVGPRARGWRPRRARPSAASCSTTGST